MADQANPANPNDHENVSRVSLRPPPFWKPDPAIWFIQLESQFRVCRIITDQTKYDHVVSALDGEILSHISDFLIETPEEEKYEKLKKRLISLFADSETQRIQKLLNELDLGDNKPSQLLCQMKHFGANKLDNNFLRTLWLRRLPAEMRAILSASSDTLDKLSEMADKIWELRPTTSSFVNSCSSAKRSMSDLPQDTNEQSSMDKIQQQLSELTLQVAELSRRNPNRDDNYNRNRSFSRRRWQSRSRSPNRESRNTNSTRVCYYHQKFKDQAKKCVFPCSKANTRFQDSEN